LDGDGGRLQSQAAGHQPDGYAVFENNTVHALNIFHHLARQKRAELKSVLDPQTKKRVGKFLHVYVSRVLLTYLAEILIQRVKKLQPEEIAWKIQQFDQELCTQSFLSELKPVLPSPEQVSHDIYICAIDSSLSKVGKLNVYRNADPEELAGLHPSDRLMVKLIQIDRLGPRIEGMLYKCDFEETLTLLDEVTQYILSALVPTYFFNLVGTQTGGGQPSTVECQVFQGVAQCMYSISHYVAV
jgi:hypothetical protein